MSDFEDNPKFAQGKLKTPHHFVPVGPLRALARVMAAGAKKYGFFNWRTQGIDTNTYYAAMRRHIDDWFDGQDTDPDDGEHPLTHVMACCSIVLDAKACDKLTDNRPHTVGVTYEVDTRIDGIDGQWEYDELEKYWTYVTPSGEPLVRMWRRPKG